MTTTKQEDFWQGEFGRAYTDRNSRDPGHWDAFYRSTWGTTKIEMNEKAIGSLPRNTRILEVGCNTGMQLAGLQRMGFTDVWGCDIQQYAVDEGRKFVQNAQIVKASALDLPFKDGFFDLVVTNGVLIHIAPDDLGKVVDEMVRCSRRYIWGFEYYAVAPTEIDYRGEKGFLWKRDFAAFMLDRHPTLKLVRKDIYPYVAKEELGKEDVMYLLERNG
jgi:pseudaminic acid biosynthesis-associated methylase